MGLFKRSSPEEDQLRHELIFAINAIRLGGGDAAGTADEIIAASRETRDRFVKAGSPLVSMSAERLLQDERAGSAAPFWRDYLATIRADGVQDGDIREYWSLPVLTRIAFDRLMEVLRTLAVISIMEQNVAAGIPLTDKKAAIQRASEQFRRRNALFGRPGEPVEWSPADRYLPIELQTRVTRWTTRSGQAAITHAEQHSSFNAMIRAKVRAGEI